jgi:hypothetical protein
LVWVSTAQAVWVGIQKDYNLYGHVYNTDNGLVTGNPMPWCAPTATINSFRYLEQKYPSVYDTLLTKGDIVGSRNQLVNGWDQRPGMGVGGATAQSWWENKVWWIEDNAPGTTVFEGMVFYDPSTWYRSEDLVQGYPTWGFMYEQLGMCQDVEIGIQPVYTGEGHALTLTSLLFDDMNGNQMWDPGETQKIDYLDPNNPTQLFQATDLALVGERLQFTWNNGGANPNTLVYIDLAYSESIPEPATLLLLLCSVGLMLRRRTSA